ncbi:16658_t:CDS:2, partial [Racocetra persica]
KETFSKEISTGDEIAFSSLDNIEKTHQKKNIYIVSANKQAPVRDYLSSIDDDGGNICKLCKQEFGSLTAISTINQHFQNFHLAEFTKIRQLKSRRLDLYGPNDKYKKMNHILLDLILFNETHTAINQADAIIGILKKINFGQKLLGITTDNAINMLAIGHILKEKISDEFDNQDVQHFCYGVHILNIIVEEGIKSISKEISKTRDDLRMVFRSLITHLNNNENPEVNTQYAVASAMKTKFVSYWVHLNKSLTISNLLDPHNKLSTYVVNKYEQAINILHEVYENYKPAEEN